MSPFRPARTSESFISSSPPSDPAGREAWTRLPNDSAESVLAGPLGVHPSEMVGKVLKSIRVSRSHPTVTLHFADRSAFQVRVDGYDPTHPGVPKIIETSAELGPLLAADGAEHLGYTVAHAALITMTDRAFQRGKRGGSWDQRHAGVAFKFKEEGRWHCIWVSLEERDTAGRCVFKSFNDVYLERLDRGPSPKKRSRTRTFSQTSHKQEA